MNNYHVYVIKSSSSGKIYIGQTADVEARIARHNNILPHKPSSFTSKNVGPWELVYQETFNDRPSAISREKELKSFRGREFVRSVIEKINRP